MHVFLMVTVTGVLLLSAGYVISFVCMFSLRQERMLKALKEEIPMSLAELADVMSANSLKVTRFGAFLIAVHNLMSERVDIVESKTRQCLEHVLTDQGREFVETHYIVQTESFS